MKKAKKGLLLSLLTLLMAVAVTATSTYAWFITNRSVTATNMQVTLKSDTTYLVIGTAASEPANVDAIGTSTSAEATASNAAVLPVRYNPEGTGATKWEYASGAGYNDGTASGGYTAVAEANVAQYAVHYVFYVGLTSTTAENQANLKVTALTAAVGTANSTFLGAISVVLSCSGTDGTTVDFEDINTNTVKNTPSAILSTTVNKNTVYTIDAWVYVNGDNTSVKSSNAAAEALGSFTVSMTLTCEAAA